MNAPLMTVVAINTHGTVLNTANLVGWLHEHHTGPTLFAVMSEFDGPPVRPERNYAALDAAGIRVFGNRNGKTHGDRENAIAVLGDFQKHGEQFIPLTPNTNPTNRGVFYHGHNGVGQDRAAYAVWGVVGLTKVAVIAVHAPLGMFGKGGAMRWNKQARNWRTARTKLRRFARKLRKDGYTVQALAGDGNEGRSTALTGTVKWAARHGFGSSFYSRVMFVLSGGAKVIGRATPTTDKAPHVISDHPAGASVTFETPTRTGAKP